ncbi:MAG: PQQ-binding-like beta-propeller repeat protein [Spirochaetaceae bacterium]|jgi:outer membrane protein assembly factor BamB|nr:PQQ-binding-like beta-propeller repeat protein [Spirochaetaceae bacterium]
MLQRFYSLLTIFLVLISCVDQKQHEESRIYLPPAQSEIIIIAQSGDNQWEGLTESDPLHVGDMMDYQETLVTGDNSWVLLQDEYENLVLLGEKSRLSKSKENEQTLWVIQGGKISLDCKAPLLLQNQDFQMLLDRGKMSLEVNSQGVLLQHYQGILRFQPGNNSIKEMDLLFKNQWPELALQWQSFQRGIPQGRSYQWNHQYFRQNSRLISLIAQLSQGTSVDQETLQTLLEEMKEIQFPMDSALTEASPMEEITPFIRNQLRGVPCFYQRIELKPREGNIKLGPFKGYHIMELPMNGDSRIPISLSLRGYDTMEELFIPQKDSQNQIFQLHKKSSMTYNITVDPPDTLIYVNSLFAGKGQLSLTQKPGELIALDFTMEGYNNRQIILEDIGFYPQDLQISLNKTLQGQFFVSYEDPVGIGFYQGNFIVADRKGNLTAVRAVNGLRPWGVSTSNSPNDWSNPVTTDDSIYFSGRHVLAAYDPLSGETLGVYPLGGRSSHQYGRRVVAFGDTIALPTNDSIILLSKDLSTTIRVINIPGGSLITPLVVGDYLYTVSNDGRIYKISRRADILLSSFSDGYSPLGMSPVADEKNAYFADRQGRIIAFDLVDLRVIWETELPQQATLVFRDPQLDGQLLYIYNEGSLYQFNTQQGEYIQTLPQHFITPPWVENGLLYGAVEPGKFIIEDLENSRILQEVDLEAMATSAVFSQEGMVAIGMENGRIMIIHQPNQELELLDIP